MRLPGTRYQEPGWEQVRKLLGQASVQVLRQLSPHELQDPALLDRYVDETGALLHACRHTARSADFANALGNWRLANGITATPDRAQVVRLRTVRAKGATP